MDGYTKTAPGYDTANRATNGVQAALASRAPTSLATVMAELQSLQAFAAEIDGRACEVSRLVGGCRPIADGETAAGVQVAPDGFVDLALERIASTRSLLSSISDSLAALERRCAA